MTSPLKASIGVTWIDRLAAWLGEMFDGWIRRSSVINMTNLRQQVTLAAFAATTVVYLALAVKYSLVKEAKEWTPSYEWLAFIGIMSGLDITQFFAKRKTDAEYVAATQSGTPSPGTTTTTTVGPGSDPSVTTKTEPTP